MTAAAAEPLGRIARLPCWSGSVAPVPLLGGITNKNYLVTDGGQQFVVRLSKDLPVHGVVRSNELTASRAAFAAGISPEVVYAKAGVVVLRYIEGRALTAELVRDAALLGIGRLTRIFVARREYCSVGPGDRRRDGCGGGGERGQRYG